MIEPILLSGLVTIICVIIGLVVLHFYGIREIKKFENSPFFISYTEPYREYVGLLRFINQEPNDDYNGFDVEVRNGVVIIDTHRPWMDKDYLEKNQ